MSNTRFKTGRALPTRYEFSTPARIRKSRPSHRSRRRAIIAVATSLTLVAGITTSAAPSHALDLRPKGVDVASHQHPFGSRVDWRQVRLNGYSFALIKATEGTHYTNPYFEQNRQDGRRSAMIIGTYHYARPDQSPIRQALHYADTIKCLSNPLDMPPVLDLEITGGLSPILLQAWTAVFLSTLNVRCGTNTMIYTYPNFWRTAMRNTPIFSFAPLWIADYNGQDGPTTPLPGGWSTWKFWQFTSRGQVPGINAAVDLNRFNGGYVGLTSMTIRHKVVPTIPTVSVNGQWRISPEFLKEAQQLTQMGKKVEPRMVQSDARIDPSLFKDQPQ